MPASSYRSQTKERADGFTLALDVVHVLRTPEDSDGCSPKKPPDVLLASDLVVSFSGVLDGAKVSPRTAQQSWPLHHLIRYLDTNASQLGLSNVSDPYVDREDDLPKVTLTSAWPYVDPGNLNAPDTAVAFLEAINITLVCKSGQSPNSHLEVPISVFSERPYLAFVPVFDRLLDKFATFHLVRRYPLVFGTWREKLGTETSFLSQVSKSMARVAERSTHSGFKTQCSRLVKDLTKSTSRAIHPTEPLRVVVEEGCAAMTRILAECLGRLLNLSIRPHRYKHNTLRLPYPGEEIAIFSPASPEAWLTQWDQDDDWDDLVLAVDSLPDALLGPGLGFGNDADQDSPTFVGLFDCKPDLELVFDGEDETLSLGLDDWLVKGSLSDVDSSYNTQTGRAPVQDLPLSQDFQGGGLSSTQVLHLRLGRDSGTWAGVQYSGCSRYEDNTGERGRSQPLERNPPAQLSSKTGTSDICALHDALSFDDVPQCLTWNVHTDISEVTDPLDVRPNVIPFEILPLQDR